MEKAIGAIGGLNVAVPRTWGAWRAIDIDGKDVGHGAVQNATAELGKLPIGYFEIREKDESNKITVAVLAKTTPSENTPIAIDVAMSWIYPVPSQIHDVCMLCRMAGVTWIRDRSSWPEIETARDVWAEDTRYERTMRIEHEAGLKVLQVNHFSPTWASKNVSRFPEDLRDVYNFYRELAVRWKGLADAIEPWNEPDIAPFGGHTGCEIASFQKAAYLGLKAGNPQLPVCEAVFAIDRAETLDEFAANDVYPYFDQYDLHHYVKLPEYPRAYGRHRAVSGGRPMWTTEFNLPVKWEDEKTKEPADDELRVQACRLDEMFAVALNEGAQKAFYFIFGDRAEQKFQFGLVHTDLTPRPAYVAFAAVGRLLNGATPIGRVDLGGEKFKGYVFRTIVDGAERETLVAWSETNKRSVKIHTAEKAYDYLGREISHPGNVELTRAPMFVVLSRGGSEELKVAPPPAKAKRRTGTPCPVVLQLIGKGDVKESAFQLGPANELQLVAYNFGEKMVRGKLTFEGATGGPADTEIAPGARDEWTLKADGQGSVVARFEGQDMERAVVSGRVTKSAPANQPDK